MNPSNQLPRILGYVTATAIVVGCVIGSGVFKKAAAIARDVPESGEALLAWVVVGVLALLGALALAEVAVIVGKAGGNYPILRDAYGRWAGFLFGWVEFWIIRSASIAALATVFTDSLHDVLRHAHPSGPDIEVLSTTARMLMTATVIAVLGFVNARGTRLGGNVQVVITTVKVLSLLAIALLPYIVLGLTASPEAKPNVDRLKPLWPAEGVDLVKFGSALVAVFWAYHGWMNFAPIAEEVKNPHRNIPLAALTGVGIIILLYVSVNLAYYLTIPSANIAKLGAGETVAGEFAYRVLGPIGLLLASVAIMTSVFGALNGNLLVGPRLLYAMGQDGLAPKGLSRLHSRFQTPATAEAVLTGWSIALVVACYFLPDVKDPFDRMTDFAMFGALSFETSAVASIFVYRRRYPKDQVALPYRCPLYPVLPAVYVLCLAAVLVNMFNKQQTEALTGVAFVLVGAIVYILFGRRRGSANGSL
jgi:amino acid transporter